MNEIISTVVANGLWATLFTGLLIYELRDSRRREARFGDTIRSLTDRLGAVNSVQADTKRLIGDADEIKRSVAEIKARTKRTDKPKPGKETDTACAATV